MDKPFQLPSNQLQLNNNKSKFLDYQLKIMFCDKTFKKPKIQLNKHGNVHKNKKSFKCDKCAVQCLGTKGLTSHKLLDHPSRFQCKICGKSYAFSSSLSQHKRTHFSNKETQECEISVKVFQKKGNCNEIIFKHILKYRHLIFSYCAVKFETNSDLHEHSDDDYRPFKCRFCQKGFKTAPGKTAHERIGHPDTNSVAELFNCNYCGKTFSFLTHKNRHEKVHTAEKLHKCDYCQKSFRKPWDKLNHERIHTKVKETYICEFCNKAFGYLKNKEKHVTTCSHRVQ